MSEQERIDKLEKKVALLQEEVALYKDLLEKEKQKKVDLELKLTQAKDVAKKGIDVSKDIFKVTKSVFGKAKDSFKEEWDKSRFTDEKIHLDKTELGDVYSNEEVIKKATEIENVKNDNDNKQ